MQLDEDKEQIHMIDRKFFIQEKKKRVRMRVSCWSIVTRDVQMLVYVRESKSACAASISLI